MGSSNGSNNGSGGTVPAAAALPDPGAVVPPTAVPCRFAGVHSPEDIANVLAHIKAQDLSVPRRRGIGGCHDATVFDSLKDEYQVTSRTPHPTIPGIEVIEYQIYALNREGKKDVPPTLKAEKFTKTVYDPTIWTDEKLGATLSQAEHNTADRQADGSLKREWVGKSDDGTSVHGYSGGDGKITSFFIE